MAKKSTNAGAKTCTCDKCGTTAHTPSGTQHRRCSGQMDTPIRSKHDNLPSQVRGRWS
jgi:hypothetical protein